MDNINSNKRKRLITACSECVRRKQKCDRARPCNNCVSRSVPQKCAYTDRNSPEDFTLTKEESDSYLNTDSDPAVKEEPLDDLPPEDLLTQAGYSSLLDSNVLADLRAASNDGSRDVANANSASFTRSRNHRADKYRAQVILLPAPEVISELVEVYFEDVHWLTFTLERYYFNKLYTTWASAMRTHETTQIFLTRTSKEVQCFPALLYQVLAVALQFLPNETMAATKLKLQKHSAANALSQYYSEAGMEIMNILGRYNPTIPSVEADMLRCFWLKNRSRGTEAWYNLANAIRQAQDLGLHIQSEISQTSDLNVEDTLSRLWQDEYRRRLWAMLFSWDSHMALMLGRPRMVNVADCTIKVPLECDMPLHPNKTVPTSVTIALKPSLYSFALYQYAISHKIHEMLSSGAHNLHVKDYAMVRTMHDQIIALQDAVTPAMRPVNPDTTWDMQFPRLPMQRERIASMTGSLLVALHRQHACRHLVSRAAAIEAALDIMSSQQRLFELIGDESPFQRMYALAFHTIDAGVFLVGITLEYPPNDTNLCQRIEGALTQGINRLNSLQDKNAMAKSGAAVLSQCYARVRGLLQPQEPSQHDLSNLVMTQSHNATLQPNGINASNKQQITFLPINPPVEMHTGFASAAQLPSANGAMPVGTADFFDFSLNSNEAYWGNEDFWAGPVDSIDFDFSAPISDPGWEYVLG